MKTAMQPMLNEFASGRKASALVLLAASLLMVSTGAHALPAAQQQPVIDPDATVIETGPGGTVNQHISIQSANLVEESPVASTANDVEVLHPSNPQDEQKVLDAIIKELQTNFQSAYSQMIKEKLPSGEYPVRGFSANNGIELNGKITGLENITLSKGFQASTNKTDAGHVGYNVKAEMEIPQLIFDFDLVKYFPIDVFKLFPVRGHGRANMTAYLPLETKTTPNSQSSTTACVSAVDSVARAENVQVDVTFTNALGRGLQWIRNHLNLDLADSVLTNFAKTIVDVIMSILQLIICGAIEAATKSVILG